jgi:transcriptional regulator with XRE-family HTH domain
MGGKSFIEGGSFMFSSHVKNLPHRQILVKGQFTASDIDNNCQMIDNRCMGEVRENIKILRKKNKWTQGYLAERCGWDTVTVCRHERGQRSIGLPALQKYAEAFGIKISEIFDDTADLLWYEAVEEFLVSPLAKDTPKEDVDLLRSRPITMKSGKKPSPKAIWFYLHYLRELNQQM